MSSSSDVVKSIFDRVKAKDIDGVIELFDEDAVFVDCAGPTEFKGRADIKEMLLEMWVGLPDFHVQKIINMVEDGPTVLCELDLSGTHKGEYLGHAPTNNELQWFTSVVYEMTDQGKVAREAYYYDTAGLEQKLSGNAG